MFNNVDKIAILELAIERNPNVECSIIGDSLFIGDRKTDFETFLIKL